MHHLIKVYTDKHLLRGISMKHKIKNELENVFVKHYAPNNMLAHKDKRGIIKILWKLSKSWSGHLHLQHKLYAYVIPPSSSGSSLKWAVKFLLKLPLFTKILKSPSSEWRIFLYVLYIFQKPPWNERKVSLMPLWNLSHMCMPDIMILCSSASPVILFTRLLYYTKCQSWKIEIIQPNIYWKLPDIMILAQGVLHIFCS